MGVGALGLTGPLQGGVHVGGPLHLHVLDGLALFRNGDVDHAVLAQDPGQDLKFPLIRLGLILRRGQDLIGQGLGEEASRRA